MEHNQRPQDVRARGGDEIRVSKHPLSLPRVAEIVHGALKEGSTHNDATNSPGARVFGVLIFFRARFLNAVRTPPRGRFFFFGVHHAAFIWEPRR